MAIPPFRPGLIPQAPNPAANEPQEITRYYYTNPNVCRRGREEYIRFYEEDGQIKGDTYSRRRDEIIERDIDIYVTNYEGNTEKLKDLNLHDGRAKLRLMDQNVYNVDSISCRHNGNVCILTFA